MTVKEFCTQHKSGKNGIWLCPNICVNMNITQKQYEMGLDYQNIGSIPQALLEKEVVKGFIEDNVLCVIWKNN